MLAAQIAKVLAKDDAMRRGGHASNDFGTLTMSPRTMSHIDVFGVVTVIEFFSGCPRDPEET